MLDERWGWYWSGVGIAAAAAAVVVVDEMSLLKYDQRAEDWDQWRQEGIESVVGDGRLLLVAEPFDVGGKLQHLVDSCQPLTCCVFVLRCVRSREMCVPGLQRSFRCLNRAFCVTEKAWRMSFQSWRSVFGAAVQITMQLVFRPFGLDFRTTDRRGVDE